MACSALVELIGGAHILSNSTSSYDGIEVILVLCCKLPLWQVAKARL